MDDSVRGEWGWLYFPFVRMSGSFLGFVRVDIWIREIPLLLRRALLSRNLSSCLSILPFSFSDSRYLRYTLYQLISKESQNKCIHLIWFSFH